MFTAMTRAEKRAMKVRDMLARRMRSLSRIRAQAEIDEDSDAAKERLMRWRTRTEQLLADHVHPDEV